MVDTRDLKSLELKVRMGSTPIRGTTDKLDVFADTLSKTEAAATVGSSHKQTITRRVVEPTTDFERQDEMGIPLSLIIILLLNICLSLKIITLLLVLLKLV